MENHLSERSKSSVQIRVLEGYKVCFTINFVKKELIVKYMIREEFTRILFWAKAKQVLCNGFLPERVIAGRNLTIESSVSKSQMKTASPG